MRLELSLESSVVIRFGLSRMCLQEGHEFRGPNLQFEEREKIVIHLVHKALEDVVSDSVPRNSAFALLLQKGCRKGAEKARKGRGKGAEKAESETSMSEIVQKSVYVWIA
jgi:hypothetical protein